jgi:hypothetical protein
MKAAKAEWKGMPEARREKYREQSRLERKNLRKK